MQLRSKLFYSYLFFLIVYSGFILLPAPPLATLKQYNVSALGLRLIDVTIIAILAALWYAGFYGYAKLRAYSQIIEKERDGKEVAKLTKGLFILVMWLPVSSVTSAILNYFAQRHLGILPGVTVTENLISLILPLAGFVYISMGARGLNDIVGKRMSYKATNLLTLFLIYIGIIYFRLVATTSHRNDVYHMSLWAIALTLVAPYIFMWLIGLLSVYEIYSYSLSVTGIVYKKAWGILSLGLGWLIVTTVCFQYLTTLSAHLKELNIYWILVVVYLLLLVLSVGFVLIAIGTKKLQRIEEV